MTLVYAIVFGFFIFNEIPSVAELIGSALIVFAGILLVRHEANHRGESL